MFELRINVNCIEEAERILEVLRANPSVMPVISGQGTSSDATAGLASEPKRGAA